MAPRLYARLPPDRIRLFNLQPGRWDDDLIADLFEADQSFRYTALSYTWGSTVAQKEITVNGTARDITINLDLALRTIRSPDVPITLWADAVCINQDDKDDKSQQVNLMHHIFSWAAEVRAYVGDSLDRSQRSYASRLKKLAASDVFQFPEDNESAWEIIHSALSLLEMRKPIELLPHDRCLCIFGLLRALSSDHLRDRLQRMPLFSNDETGKMEPKLRSLFEWLRAFVVAPWWDRMWITQEVGVAHELRLTYGKVTISFQLLSYLVDQLRSQPFRLSAGNEYLKVLDLLVAKVQKITELRRLQQCESTSEIADLGYFQRSLGSNLLFLLRTFRYRNSSEPRDKVFALSQLLGNLGHGPHFSLKTDYHMPVAMLFCKVVTRIMHETGIFWITSADLVAKSRDKLPSWVPNWADGFTSPDAGNVAWRIRLCHNASDVNFKAFTPTITQKDMAPYEYFSKLVDDSLVCTWKRLRGDRSKREDKFNISPESGPDLFVNTSIYHLDYENAKSRCIEYKYYEPKCARDYTKVEHCLDVPAQYCTKIHHVSEPIAPDLSNLSSIIKSIKVTIHKVFPNDWEHDLLADRFDAIGRVLCFGVVLQEPNRDRLQGGWDDPNLAILVHLLSSADGLPPGGRLEVEDENDYAGRFWGKFISEAMAGCELCSVSTDRPCTECNKAASQKPIPSAELAWQDKHVQEVYDTALQTAPGNCILLTREGTLALGPPQTQVGDGIFILSGGLCPYILRQDNTPQHLEHPSFQLVGDCFLDEAPKWKPDDLKTIALV